MFYHERFIWGHYTRDVDVSIVDFPPKIPPKKIFFGISIHMLKIWSVLNNFKVKINVPDLLESLHWHPLANQLGQISHVLMILGWLAKLPLRPVLEVGLNMQLDESRDLYSDLQVLGNLELPLRVQRLPHQLQNCFRPINYSKNLWRSFCFLTRAHPFHLISWMWSTVLSVNLIAKYPVKLVFVSGIYTVRLISQSFFFQELKAQLNSF